MKDQTPSPQGVRNSHWMGKEPLSIITLLLLALLSSAPALAAPLVIGTISRDPVGDSAYFLPLSRYLADQGAEHGLDEGKVLMAADIDEMAHYLKTGKIDLYFESPLTSQLVNQLAGSEMVLRRWKEGRSSFHSVLFTRRDDPIDKPEQLRGALIAFKQPFSSTGYLLPALFLNAQGVRLQPSQQSLPELQPPPTPATDHPRLAASERHANEKATGDASASYLFSGDNEATLYWVVSGRARVGAMSSSTYEKLSAGLEGQLRVLASTPPIPRQVVNIRPGMDPALKAFLKATLVGMEHTQEGRQVLSEFEETLRFDPIPAEHRKTLEQMRPEVVALVRSQ